MEILYWQRHGGRAGLGLDLDEAFVHLVVVLQVLRLVLLHRTLLLFKLDTSSRLILYTILIREQIGVAGREAHRLPDEIEDLNRIQSCGHLVFGYCPRKSGARHEI